MQTITEQLVDKCATNDKDYQIATKAGSLANKYYGITDALIEETYDNEGLFKDPAFAAKLKDSYAYAATCNRILMRHVHKCQDGKIHQFEKI